ncbi:hypothetical protein AAG570_001072 [Ranatra chinensis]|uniref:Uncharacterized protein n=1 Tax=Ranatra chinensis TaxID=642074 RepID=A0ABD0YB19_9HEMI
MRDSVSSADTPTELPEVASTERAVLEEGTEDLTVTSRNPLGNRKRHVSLTVENGGARRPNQPGNGLEKRPLSEIVVRSRLGVIEHRNAEVVDDTTTASTIEGVSTELTPDVPIARRHDIHNRGRMKHLNSINQEQPPRRRVHGNGQTKRRENGKQRNSTPKYYTSYSFESKKSKVEKVTPPTVSSTSELPSEEANIQVTSYLADSESAIDMKDLAESDLDRPGVTGADVISAFFVTDADEAEGPTSETNEVGRTRHRFAPSSTFKPIVVPDEELEGVLEDLEEIRKSHPQPKILSPEAGLVHNDGNSGVIRRGRFTTTPQPPPQHKDDITPAPDQDPPVLVTPRSSLTSSDPTVVLAPIQAAISLSQNKKTSPTGTPEVNTIEKQVIDKQTVYKTYIDVQKSIPFEIKEIKQPQTPPPEVVPEQKVKVEIPVQPAYSQNFLQQVMLAYQKLSNNPNYLSSVAVSDPPQVNFRQHSPLAQNLYYIYKNRYGVQPHQIYYYLPPYTSEPPQDTRLNSGGGYIGRYIMQHSHENTGRGEQPIYHQPHIYSAAIVGHGFGQPFLDQDGFAGRLPILTLNNHNILHENGATSTSYFKIGTEGSNNVEGDIPQELLKPEDVLFRPQYEVPEQQAFVLDAEQNSLPDSSKISDVVSLPVGPSEPPPFQEAQYKHHLEKVPIAYPLVQYLPQFVPYLPAVSPKPDKKHRNLPFRPSQPVYTSQYPPQTYSVLSTVRGGPHPRSIRAKKLCIEYGGFKPPLVPSVQIDDKFFEKQDADEKVSKEE